MDVSAWVTIIGAVAAGIALVIREWKTNGKLADLKETTDNTKHMVNSQREAQESYSGQLAALLRASGIDVPQASGGAVAGTTPPPYDPWAPDGSNHPESGRSQQ
jgi:hypothetical protein